MDRMNSDVSVRAGWRARILGVATSGGLGLLAGLALFPLLASGAAAQSSEVAASAARSADEIVTSALDPLAQTGPAPALFDSVPVPVARLGITERWQAILADGPARPFIDGCEATPEICQSAPMRAFRRLEAENEDKPLPRLVLVRKVNLAVNHSVRYQLDPVTWGVEDYWATPRETLQKGAGDCEDFAILKMGMLAALGIPLSAMQVVVVQDLRRGIGHAVLTVRMGPAAYVLDNQTDMVRRDDSVPDYQPFYSVGSGVSYVYGMRRSFAAAPSAPANGPATLDAVAELRGTLGAGKPAARR
jgi:predicted transglutaminase-like cysteine proteinase